MDSFTLCSVLYGIDSYERDARFPKKMYRKIDVDTLTVEDDQFMEQEFKFTPEQVQAQTSEKESNVKQSLAR